LEIGFCLQGFGELKGSQVSLIPWAPNFRKIWVGARGVPGSFQTGIMPGLIWDWEGLGQNWLGQREGRLLGRFPQG